MAKTLIIGDFTLTSEFDISLTQQRELFEQPDKRGGERTLSVKVVGNAQSNECFNFYFDANASGFDPRKRVDALLYDNGVPYFEGVAKLVEVVKIRDKVTYSIVIFGKIIDLFSEFEDKSIRDLDLWKYNHTYNQESINNSIDNLNRVNGTITTVTVGEGYRYINGNFGDYKPQFVRNIRPAWYIKEIFLECINFAGYRLKSEFFDNDVDLPNVGIINAGEWEKTADEVSGNTVIASRGSDVLLTGLGGSFLMDFSTISSDPSSSYSSGVFTAPESGKFNVEGAITYNLRWRRSTTTTSGSNNFFHPQIVLFNVTKNRVSASIRLSPVTYTANTTINQNDDSSTVTSSYLVEDIELEEGDDYEMRYLGTVSRGNFDLSYIPTRFQPRRNDFSFNFRSGSTLRINPNAEIGVGSVVSAANSLPDIKIKDFMKWVMNMYNMQLDYDKFDPKMVIIEPYDDYLSDDIIEVPLDLSKEIVTTPIPDELSGNWQLTYKGSEDAINSRYESRFDQVFGTKEKLSENEFVRSGKRVEIGFSVATFYRISEDDKYITSCAKEDGSNSGGAFVGYIKNNISCNSYAVIESPSNFNQGLRLTRYSYMGNLDDPENPTRDISFAPPKAMYHFLGGASYTATNATLYNLFWRKRIARYQSPLTKMLRCYVHVTQSLLNDMTFDKLYFLNNQYYRLLSINNFKGSKKTTQCMFVSELFIPDFTPETEDVTGGGDTFENGDDIPIVNYIGTRYRGQIGHNDGGTVASSFVVGADDGGQGVSMYSFGTSTPYGAVSIMSPFMTDMEAGQVYINGYAMDQKVDFNVTGTQLETGNDITIPIETFGGFRIIMTEIVIKSTGTPFSGGIIFIKYNSDEEATSLPNDLLSTTDKTWRVIPDGQEVGTGRLIISFQSVATNPDPSFNLQFIIKYKISYDN